MEKDRGELISRITMAVVAIALAYAATRLIQVAVSADSDSAGGTVLGRILYPVIFVFYMVALILVCFAIGSGKSNSNSKFYWVAEQVSGLLGHLLRGLFNIGDD